MLYLSLGLKIALCLSNIFFFVFHTMHNFFERQSHFVRVESKLNNNMMSRSVHAFSSARTLMWMLLLLYSGIELGLWIIFVTKINLSGPQFSNFCKDSLGLWWEWGATSAIPVWFWILSHSFELWLREDLFQTLIPLLSAVFCCCLPFKASLLGDRYGEFGVVSIVLINT